MIVVCGSFGDLDHFLKVLEAYRQRFGRQNVFPDDEHMECSRPCIDAHHRDRKETEDTIEMRSKLMRVYFFEIDNADLVVIMNEKNGKEYYGVGTTMELGYALAKGKRIAFTRTPTNPNILSLINGQHTNNGLCQVSQ